MDVQTGSEADFEYDESLESDEGYEASDEADIESDESDETVEADYEFAAESDESDETVESDEASLEAAMETDEAVESVDEAEAGVSVSAGAAVRADQDRARRRQREFAMQQRREVARAVATQQDIARRIRAIPTAPKTRTYSIGRLQGAGVVTATLPNGRRTQMRLVPAPAPINEVNKLRTAINYNDKRQATAIAANTRAIQALATAQAAAVKKLTADQVKSDRELAKRIVEGDTRLDKRITAELGGNKGVLGKQHKRMMRMLRRQRQRALWNNILLTTAMPIFAAYGDRSSPLSPTNLKLTGSLAGWLVGDELLDSYMRSPGKAGRTTSTIANTLSYVAPIGNAATAYLLLKDRQHERFVTGTATFGEIEASKPGTLEITNFGLAKKTVDGDEFAKLEAGRIAAVATVVSGGDPDRVLTAQVANGKLILTLASGTSKVTSGTKVAYMIDTRPLATTTAS